MPMRRWTCFVAALLAFSSAVPAIAKVEAYPAAFEIRDIAANGTTLHVRVGGDGPVAVLLHGFGDTGDMWAPLAARLVKDHKVVVPDLRGMGLSARPETGYDKKNEGKDVADVLEALKIDGPV